MKSPRALNIPLPLNRVTPIASRWQIVVGICVVKARRRAFIGTGKANFQGCRGSLSTRPASTDDTEGNLPWKVRQWVSLTLLGLENYSQMKGIVQGCIPLKSHQPHRRIVFFQIWLVSDMVAPHCAKSRNFFLGTASALEHVASLSGHTYSSASATPTSHKGSCATPTIFYESSHTVLIVANHHILDFCSRCPSYLGPGFCCSIYSRVMAFSHVVRRPQPRSRRT